MATSVPPVTFGDRGFIAPAAPAVLAGVQADINAAFGRTLNYQLTTPQGQLASSEAAVIFDVNSIFVYYTNQVDPAYATGRMQDAIARIYFLERLPAEPTVLQVECSGALGVAINLGASVVDGAGNVYLATQAGVIPSSGLLTLPFAAQVPGPTPVPEQVGIYQAIPGWDSAAVVSGAVGQNTESRWQFEARRRQSVAKNSVGMLNSVLGEVLSVTGVLDAYVTENDLPTLQEKNGYTLAPNSIYVAVVGGAADEVARAIWRKKAPGCAYNGNTIVTVADDNAGYSPPVPTYLVRYETPEALPIMFKVVLNDSPLVPADAADQVRAALFAAFNGVDGGARARIGSRLYASRYMMPVLALGQWVQLQSLQIGSPNDPGAVIVGQIAGTTLTVTTLTSGAVAAGQTLFGDGVVVGTTIISQIGGTPGGIGTYAISAAHTVASESMICASANQSSTQAQINQNPTLAAENISVTVVA